MRKNMKVCVYYGGKDPNDIRHYDTYLGVTKIEFDEYGNLQLTSENNTTEVISNTYTDYIEVEVNDKKYKIA